MVAMIIEPHNPEVEHEAGYDDYKIGNKSQAQEPTDNVKAECSCLRGEVTSQTSFGRVLNKICIDNTDTL